MRRDSRLQFLVTAAIFLGLAFASVVSVPARAQSQGVSYVTLHDPREDAFSIATPKGWKIYGGLFRFGYVDARPLIDMTSPDGKINMRIGDATIPPYTVAGRFTRPSDGQRAAAYASGEQFAIKYGQARFGSMCQSLEGKGSRTMPPKYHPVSQGMMRTTGGEAYFTCNLNGQPMFGYVYSETFLIGSGGPLSNWYVVAIGSFLSPVDQAKAVGEMLKHSADSMALNPQWAAAQQQRSDMATQALLGHAQATMQATAAMNARQQQMIRGEQNDNFNDIINGVSFTRDSATGQEYEVPLGNGSPKWVNGSQVVVQSGMSPGAGFNQLQAISR